MVTMPRLKTDETTTLATSRVRICPGCNERTTVTVSEDRYPTEVVAMRCENCDCTREPDAFDDAPRTHPDSHALYELRTDVDDGEDIPRWAYMSLWTDIDHGDEMFRTGRPLHIDPDQTGVSY